MDLVVCECSDSDKYSILLEWGHNMYYINPTRAKKDNITQQPQLEQSRFDLLKDGTSEAQKAEKAAQTAAEIALKNARLAQIPLELQAKQTDIRSKYGLPAEVGYQTQERLAG